MWRATFEEDVKCDDLDDEQQQGSRSYNKFSDVHDALRSFTDDDNYSTGKWVEDFEDMVDLWITHIHIH